MTTLSLTFLIVFLLVVLTTGRLTKFENYFYSFPSKEISYYFSFCSTQSHLKGELTKVIPKKNILSLFLKHIAAITVSNKKHTTYHNNYFVAFNNIKLLV